MGGQRVAKPEGGSKLPWIVAGTVVGVLAAGYLGLCAWADSRDAILPNVSVAGVDVSSMTVEQARAAVQTALDQQGKDISLSLVYEDLEEQLDMSKLAADVGQSVQDAWSVGHSSFFTGGPQLLSHMIGASTQVPLAMPENEPAQADLMARMEQTVKDATQDHGYALEGFQLVMTKGAPVATVDWEAVRTDMGEKLQQALEARLSGRSSAVRDTVVLSASQSEAEEPDFEAIHREVYAEPKDAALDPASMTIADHAVGIDFDVEQLRNAYRAAKSGETVIIPLDVTRPSVTREDLEAQLFRDVLGEATTTVTGTANRKYNVKLAADSCNGTIILPGEEFSYNTVTGGFSESNGYRPAPIYVAGRSEDGIGGGVCQGSSTIYYAVLHTTLEIVERHDHQFTVSYLPAGMDATVYGDVLDFRFRNNTNYPIKLTAESYDSKGVRYLTVKLYGTNEDGRYAVPTNAVFDRVEPTTVYKPDPNVPRGTLVLDKEQYSYVGKKARTYRTVYEADGTQVERQDLGVSSYKMRPNTYFYNPEDGDPETWVNGVPPVDPGTAAPPETGTPAVPDVTAPGEAGTAPEPEPELPPPGSDSGLNPIDPGTAV